MKQFFTKIATGVGNLIYGGAKLIARHPYVGYAVIALPACFLMCNGALALAGEAVDLSDEIKKEEK